MPNRSRASTRRHSAALGPAGASLVELLVAVAVMALVAAGASTYFQNLNATQMHGEYAGDRVDVRNMLHLNVDCVATYVANGITPATCATAGAGTPVKLVQKSGGILVSKTNTAGGATKLGEWTVRASCYGIGTTITSPGIHVDVARPKGTFATPLSAGTAANFNTDQFDHSVLSWAHPKSSLFAAGAELCQKDFLANGCPSTALADYGGLALPALEDDSNQRWTPLPALGATRSYADDRGKLVCRYYAPLVHAGNPLRVDVGPGSWQVDTVFAGVQINHHYGNVVRCPPQWVAVQGGGSCDVISAPCNESGGFIARSAAYPIGSSRNWLWAFSCDAFYNAACQHEAIANGMFVDCAQP